MSNTASGQWVNELSTIRTKTILLKDTISLDIMPILPQSLTYIYRQKIVDPSLFHFNSKNNTIYSSIRLEDSLTVSYRIIPIRMNTSRIVRRNSSETNTSQRSSFNEISTFGQNPEESNQIDYSGSFIRGITVGSRQDAAVNSGFNLNMNGRLANGLEIQASMTDANIPIQPEGNSASIQEFDRIFIQLRKDSHQITLGDFDLMDNTQFKFLKFDRKLQGIKYQSVFPLKNAASLTVGATAALARGTFARNVFTAQENNQGPYKLFGNNNETFIIIIAGTERVFINGQLMKRGTENDYTINYNVGEIVFTPHRMITKDLRIIVEFQYSDRSFFRYVLEGNTTLTHKKVKLSSQIFVENDNKNQTLNRELTKSQIQRLSEIGNQIDSALINAETSVVWESSRITYLKKDTNLLGTIYNIYQWAENSTNDVYQVLFTQVGFQKGNYILKATAANGAVYQWVAPIDGIPQGSYEPVLKITTPKSHLQWNTLLQYQANGQHSTRAEISYSHHDLNTFSALQNDQNKGVGISIGHKFQKKIDTNQTIYAEIDQEYTSSFFSPVTRYRNNEFQRDWSIDLPIRNQTEQSMTSLGIGYIHKKMKAQYRGQYFYVSKQFSGIQSNADISYQGNRWAFLTNHNLMTASRHDSSILFYRPKASISYFFSPKKSMAELGFYHELQSMKDSVNYYLRNSFYWQNYFLKITNKLSSTHDISFQYIYRTEQQYDSLHLLSPHIKAHTFSVDGSHEFSNSQFLKYNLKYRNFYGTNQSQEIQHNYLGRIDYSSYYAGGFVRANSVYELKAGREQRIQLTYLKAPNGFGAYAWRDLNNNNVFELNEAYVSPISTENNYMRFFIALPEYVSANELNFSQLISVQPKAKWHNAKDWKRLASKFSYHLRIDINKKLRMGNELNITDYTYPFASFNDSLLIFSRSSMFQQLSFQKNEKKIGFDLEWIFNNSGNLLSNGIESYSKNQYLFRSRIELLYHLTYIGKIANGIRANRSEFFTDRNYTMVENELENTLSFLVNKNFRIHLNANYSFRSTGNQYSISQQGDIEAKIARKNDGIIESKFTLLQLYYTYSQPNPQIELAMLNGIPSGLNYIWNLTIGQKLTKFLQLNIIYNGRKNQNTPQLIHSGNIEARAIF